MLTGSMSRVWTVFIGITCTMSVPMASALDVTRSGDLNCSDLCELGQGQVKGCACAETPTLIDENALNEILDSERGMYPEEKRQAPKSGIFRWGKRGDTPVFRWGKRGDAPANTEDSLADNYKRLFRWGKRDSKTPVFRWGKKRTTEYRDDVLDSYDPRAIRGNIFRWGKRDPSQAVFRWGRSTRRMEEAKVTQDAGSRSQRLTDKAL